MLTIIYPEGDYTAADIAIRAQALAQGQGKQLYIVPKHLGRNKEAILKKLNKTNETLFISYDKSVLDENTRQELNFLLEKGKKIHAIVPEQMILTLDNTKPYYYSKKNKYDFSNAIQRFIAENQPPANAALNKHGELLILIGVLLLSILLLSTIANDKK